MRTILTFVIAIFVSTAQAAPMESQIPPSRMMPSKIYEGTQRPPEQPRPKGYVTEDGKRYGTCRNRSHHGRHPHCKELVPLPKKQASPAQQKKPQQDTEETTEHKTMKVCDPAKDKDCVDGDSVKTPAQTDDPKPKATKP